MQLACVLVPRFALAVEQRLDRRLDEATAVVYDGNRVVEASADAGSVWPGQALRQAKALHPHALFIRANPALYREVAAAMLDALETVAPLVEPAGEGVAYADVRGLGGHYADEFALAGRLVEAVRDATGLLAGAGIASGKFTARVAALLCPPGDAGVVPAGRERAFLADKPASLLPINAEIVQRLDALALRTLGDIAALPAPAVEAQFRTAGRRIWQLSNGVDDEPLRPRTPDESLTERLSFESPVVATEALLMAARQIVRRLAQRLDRSAARRMHIQLLADERIIWERAETFREATSDEGRIQLLARTRLAMLTLAEAVDAAVITLSGIGREAAKQPKLIPDVNPQLDQVADAIRQIRARYGRPMVWRAVDVDPCSRHPEERSALIPYDA